MAKMPSEIQAMLDDTRQALGEALRERDALARGVTAKFAAVDPAFPAEVVLFEAVLFPGQGVANDLGHFALAPGGPFGGGLAPGQMVTLRLLVPRPADDLAAAEADERARLAELGGTKPETKPAEAAPEAAPGVAPDRPMPTAYEVAAARAGGVRPDPLAAEIAAEARGVRDLAGDLRARCTDLHAAAADGRRDIARTLGRDSVARAAAIAEIARARGWRERLADSPAARVVVPLAAGALLYVAFLFAMLALVGAFGYVGGSPPVWHGGPLDTRVTLIDEGGHPVTLGGIDEANVASVIRTDSLGRIHLACPSCRRTGLDGEAVTTTAGVEPWTAPAVVAGPEDRP